MHLSANLRVLWGCSPTQGKSQFLPGGNNPAPHFAPQPIDDRDFGLNLIRTLVLSRALVLDLTRVLDLTPVLGMGRAAARAKAWWVRPFDCCRPGRTG